MNLYTTQNEAIEREIIAPLRTSEDVTGPVEDAFDIEAIAEETIVQRVNDWGQVYYCQRPELDADEFWEIVMRHAR